MQTLNPHLSARRPEMPPAPPPSKLLASAQRASSVVTFVTAKMYGISRRIRTSANYLDSTECK
jgi:hypothetical protein